MEDVFPLSGFQLLRFSDKNMHLQFCVCVKDENLVKQDLIFNFCFANMFSALESGLLFMFVQHFSSLR